MNIKNIDVQFISIITDEFKPKNGKNLLIKSEKIKTIKIDKADIKGLLYVTVMKADEKDSDGHIFSFEEVEKAAHNFLKKGFTNAIDENHNLLQKENVYIVESYLDNKDKSWKAVIDISQNELLMQKAKENTINGVSIFGYGQIEKAIEEKEETLFRKILNKFEKNKSEDCKMELTKKDVVEIVKAVLKEERENAELKKAEQAKEQKYIDLEKAVDALKQEILKSDAKKDDGTEKKIQEEIIKGFQL